MSIIGTQILFPPAIESYMPAFLAEESCLIYFSMTRFNDPTTIKHVQLSLNYMNSNLTALDRTLWPNAYKPCAIYKDNTIATDHCYYIKIDPQDLEGTDAFQIQQYYKVQLRFSSVDPINMTYTTETDEAKLSFYPSGSFPNYTEDPGASWYQTQINLGYFSEWSSVCLIKGIPEPYISIQGLKQTNQTLAGAYDNLGLSVTEYETDIDEDPANGYQHLTADQFDGNTLGPFMNETVYFTGQDIGYGSMVFSGQYSNGDTSEVLDTFQATLYYAGILNNPVSDTGIQHPYSTYRNGDKYNSDGSINYDTVADAAIFNSIRFNFDTILEDGVDYELQFKYTTKNGYTHTEIYPFTTAFSNIYFPSLTLVPKVDEENGRLGITVSSLDTSGTGKLVPVSGVLLMKRADHRSNFTSWKTIYEKQISNEVLNETIYDYAAESGVFYKYAINNTVIPDPIMAVYEDIFIIGADKQLKVQFNPQVSSFKIVVQDSKTETLGGRYPIITRNGNIKYREISIGGLISAQSDENNLFTNEEELYGNYSTNYSQYNQDNNITEQIDRIREKEFRNKVLDFLHDGKVKLFKSTTEGNALVRVTDVSLSPIDTLGRMLYSFSATLTEVAETTIENCKNSGIELCGVYSDLVYMTVATIMAGTNGKDIILGNAWTSPITISGNAPAITSYNKNLVYIYIRSTEIPILPTSLSKYVFSSDSLTNLNNGWSYTIPVPNGNPLYTSVAIASSKTNSVMLKSSEWGFPVKLAMNISTIALFKRGSSSPSLPAGNLMYNFPSKTGTLADNYDGLDLTASSYDSFVHNELTTVETESNLTAIEFDKGNLITNSIFGTGTLTGNLDGWSMEIPSGTANLYSTLVTVFSNQDNTIIYPSQWSAPIVVIVTNNEINEFAKNKIIYIYKEKMGDKPPTPSGNLFYNFNTDTISSGNLEGWSTTKPSTNTLPLYFSAITAIGSSTASTVTLLPSGWTPPDFIGYYRPVYSSQIRLFAKQSGKITPKPPINIIEYSFTSNQISGYLGNWSRTNPLGTG